jgi:hypothetical protein
MSQEELCAICGEEVAYLNDMGYCPACSFSEVAVYPADPLTEDDVEELLAPAATADRLLMEERTVAVPVTTHMNVSQPEPAPRSQPEPGNRKASGLADRLKRRGVRMKPDYGPDDAPHVMVTARAGTGKTTTLVQGMRGVLGKDPEEMISDGRWVRITPSEQQQAVWDAMRLSTGLRPCDICFAAFGNKIAKELQRRVPYGCTATTFHKMGFKAVMQRFQLKEGDGAVFGYRTRRHVAELLGLDEYELTRTRPALAHAASSLVRLCKQNLVILDAEDEYEDRRAVQELDALVEHFDVELGQDKYELYKLMPQLLHRALDVEKDQFIDFEDMIWLPVMMGLPLPKYKLLLVDEAQDLNICQQQMARRVGDRIIMCGDDRQAIFGFAGADADSMPRSYQELSKTPRGCVELKLTTTRRCGKAIVTRAKQYVEEFEAHEDNCEGSLRYASYEEGYAGVYPEGLPHEAYYAGGYRSHVRDGDFVLCRVGAPLVSQCLRFLREGRKAVILGRDVGQNLIALVRSRKAQTMEQLYARMVDWHTEQITKERAKERPSELRIASIQDKYQCIVAFCQGRNSVDDVVAAIRRVFQEDTGSGIVFSTIHKAKGLEAKRVFLLQPRGARMPHPMAKLEWEVQQEHNLAYVAITRAIEELVFVS